MKTFLLIAALLQVSPPPQGIVAGQVRGANNKPAANIRVAVVATDETGNLKAETELVRIGRTDAEGRYRLDEIPVGRYAVIAGSVESPTYYPGTTNPADPKAVLIAAASPSVQIDFALAAEVSAPRAFEDRQVSQLYANQAANRSQYPQNLKQVTGRMVLEDGSAAPILSDEFSLSFSDSSRQVQVEASLDQSAIRIKESTAWDARNGSVQIKAVVPVFSDGRFQLEFAEGDYKVAVKRTPDANINAGGIGGLYVKSVTLLGKNLMTTRGPFVVRSLARSW